MVIGVIGGVGSGKSTVCALLAENHGYRLIELDRVAKELERPGNEVYERLFAEFGPSILKGEIPGAEIDPAAFAELIFADRDARERAEAIIHPAVWDYAYGLVSAPGKWCIETALPEPGFKNRCDRVVYVKADAGIRIERLMASRGYSIEKCRNIIASQKNAGEFEKMADIILDNSSGRDALDGKIAGMFP